MAAQDLPAAAAAAAAVAAAADLACAADAMRREGPRQTFLLLYAFIVLRVVSLQR